jgi:hypothetical protein
MGGFRAILYRAAVAKKVRTMKKVVHAVRAAKFARAAKANAVKTRVLTRAAKVHAAKAALGR